MPGFDNGCLYFESGIDPRGTTPIANQMTDGTLLIGSSVSPYVVSSTLTAGTGISITNGAGSITITASFVGLSWSDVTTATQALAVNHGYVTDRAAGVTYTLPATASFGEEIRIDGKSGTAVIAQNAGQQILMGNLGTTVGVGGTLTATDAGDCVHLRCITGGAATVWRVESSMGNWAIV